MPQKPKKTKAILDAERRLKILIQEGQGMRESGIGRLRPTALKANSERASELAKHLRIMRRAAGVQ